MAIMAGRIESVITGIRLGRAQIHIERPPQRAQLYAWPCCVLTVNKDWE